MKKILAIAAAGLLIAGVSHAQQAMQARTPWSAEVGYTAATIADGTNDFNPGTLRGIVGYEFGPNLAFEGMAGFSVMDDTIGGVDGQVRSTYGLYVKPKVKVTPQLEVFARLGGARTRFTAAPGGAAATDTFSDWSWGAGVNYSFTPTTYVGLDYLQLFDKNGIKNDGWTIGVGMRF